MNRIMSGLLATALSASFAVAEIVPVNAQPIYVPLGQNVASDVQTVDHRRWRRFDGDRDFSRRDFSRRDFRRSFSHDDGRYWR
ncbi:MAG: BA14K family protein, partial [Mesorhizobium sp.]